jgi:hypothetical protein
VRSSQHVTALVLQLLAAMRKSLQQPSQLWRKVGRCLSVSGVHALHLLPAWLDAPAPLPRRPLLALSRPQVEGALLEVAQIRRDVEVARLQWLAAAACLAARPQVAACLAALRHRSDDMAALLVGLAEKVQVGGLALVGGAGGCGASKHCLPTAQAWSQST